MGEFSSIRALLDPFIRANNDDSSRALVFSSITAVNALKEFEQEESIPSNWDRAFEVLKGRVPNILLFSEEDRNLESEYNLTEVADDPPRALQHLAALAGLDLKLLRDDAVAGMIEYCSTRRDVANERLAQIFAESWNQGKFIVQLEVSGTILQIQAREPTSKTLFKIQQRSEGVRWFAALLAFARRTDDGPILLIDELEQHLHYDAQADLVNVLSNQSYASSVIYTTHSLGCLPNDLGTGVRVVKQKDDSTSVLQNGFWSDGAGFTPLLASMGAAAMSFTPARRALIGEGIVDAILLPSLFREVAASGNIDFRIAPGISNISADEVPEIVSQAGQIVFIADGDQGGKKNKAKLEDGGIGSDRILLLNDGKFELETEDLVDPEVYVNAVNAEIQRWQTGAPKITVADIGMNLRSKNLGDWCIKSEITPPDKVAVAQEIVNQVGTQSIIDKSRHGYISELLHSINELLGLRELGHSDS